MIRITRVCFLGKNKFNIPVFPQRTVSLPNQIVVDFSVTADKVNVGPKKRNDITSSPVSLPSEKPSKIYFNELKYNFFKQTLAGLGNKQESALFDEKTAKKFYEKVYALKPFEIIKIVGLLAELKSRPPECLKILCTLLASYETTKLTAYDCADLLYFLAKLSFRDEVLINSLCERLKTLSPELKSQTAANIIYSLSSLKIRNTELIQLLLQQILLQPMVLKNSLKALKALCVLNYKSSDVDDLIQPLSLLNELDFIHSLDYVTFIWSCVILEKYHCISSEHFRKVFSQNYICRVLRNSTVAPFKLKLLNINAAIQHWSDYNGPVLDEQSFQVLVSSVPRNNSLLLDAVADTLSHIVPIENIKSNVNIGTGFILDVQFSNTDPSNQSNSRQERSVGIVLLNYNDICSDGIATGITAFKLKILEQRQYKLLTLRYDEFDISLPLSPKIEVLRSKISKMEEHYKNKELASTESS